MDKIVFGIILGVVAILVAWFVNTTSPSFAADLTAAIGLASTVLGFFGVTIAVGTIGQSVRTKGFAGVTTDDARVPGLAAIVGAILLAAH
jgi:hypothetical protein